MIKNIFIDIFKGFEPSSLNFLQFFIPGINNKH